MTRMLWVWMCLLLLPGMAFAQVTIGVNLNTNEGPMTHNAAGHLHGVSSATPVDQYITPLKLQMVSCGFPSENCPAMYTRLEALGVPAFQYNTADIHGFDPSGPWPGDGGSLVNGAWVGGSFTNYNNIVTTAVNAAVAAGQTKWQWNIWGEADRSQAWNRTQPQFYAMWKQAFQAIRAVDPSAVIVGPSFSFYAPGAGQGTKDFLTFAHANSVCPDILSWHELNGPDTEGYHALEANVTNIRAYIASTGRCPATSTRISINELTGNHEVYNPGALVRYYAAIERMGVESSAHACWADFNEVSNCATAEPRYNLNGLLTMFNQTPPLVPRPTWWASKFYGDMPTGGTKLTVTYASTVDAVAVKNGTSAVHILVGRNDGTTSVPVTVNLTNSGSASYIVANNQIHMVATRIPGGGSGPFTPTQTTVQDIPVVSGAASFVLNMNGGDAYSVVLGAHVAQPDDATNLDQ